MLKPYCKYPILRQTFVARYLIVIMAAILAACTYSSSGEERDGIDYPETLNDGVRISAVFEGGDYVAPGAMRYGLTGFTRHASVADGERGRVREFEVLYHAPNRHAGVAAPYLPASVPDRLMIMFRGEVFIEEMIEEQFAGTQGTRNVHVAQLNVSDKRYLLVTSNSDAKKPMWLAIYTSSGKLLYRSALAHGGYRFVEHQDGISMLDQAGHGKRITLL